jgi:PAS domain S-box-containing protein
MQQPVSFCTACLFAPTRFAKPPVLKNTETRVQRSCVVYPKCMNDKIEERLDDTQILFTLDLAGNFKFVDATAARTFGYPAEKMCGMNIAELVAPDYAGYLQEQIARAGVGELGVVYEVEMLTKDQNRLALEISTRLVMRNGLPLELEGIAFPRVNTWEVRPRCLDEEFWIGPGLNGPSTLTFLPTR